MTAATPDEPDDGRARRARSQRTAPTSGRIVVISAAVGAGPDRAADELGRRLLARGWWVDRPDGLRILPGRIGPALRGLRGSGTHGTPRAWSGLLPSGTHGVAAIVTGAALDRLTARTEALIGDPPHAVVSTHPLVSQLLGRLRRSGTLRAPAISYLTVPAVHPLWWHAGVDLVLAPHPSVTEQALRLARSSPGRTQIIETAPALPLAQHVANAEGVASERAEPARRDEAVEHGAAPRPDPAEVIHDAALAHVGEHSRPGDDDRSIATG